MENFKKGVHISQLIVRDLQGCISPEEKLVLNDWLKKDPENIAIYKRVQSRENCEKRQEIIQKLNKRVAWDKVNMKTRELRSPVLGRWMKYVAVFMLPLLAGGICAYLIQNRKEVQPIIRAMHISPGSTKAELVLAGGQRVVLDSELAESLANEGGVNIVKNEDGISYIGNEEVGDLVYNTMRVPRGGEFKVRLQDGTMVYLNSETELKYPVRFVGEERRVYLSGEAYFEVQKDSIKPFVVVMEDSEVQVLGTEFNARSYRNERYQSTTLVTGKVLLTTGDHQSIELLPSEQGVINEHGDIKKEKVDTKLYTAWKNGNFVFRKQRLENIMKIVERWYELKVIFEDEWCKEVTFSGSVERYGDFCKLSDMLEATGSVKFRIENNEVYVTKR